MNSLANILTYFSLAFGFTSIIFSLEGHFTFACWSIILSVVLDGLDGQVARRNPSPSNFGKELDSLVDVVSFGIAPSVLGYIFVYREFYLYLALFVYLFCSVTRLAKYNITEKQEMVDSFFGLPTTVSGGVLASFILIFRKGKDVTPLPEYIPLVFILVILLLSFLMVSRVRYLNLDGLKQFFGKKLKISLFFLAILLIAAFSFRKGGTVLFSLFLIYLLFSPFMVKRLSQR